MIRRLRRNFIIIAMCSMMAVLAVIVCSLNVANYISMVSRADKILNMLAENNGHFPDGFSDTLPQKERMPGGYRKPMVAREFSEETPYDTRFFSVKLDENGEVIFSDTGRIAAVETAEAVEYAKEVLQKGKTSGFLQNYRYINRRIEEEGCYQIIFVDCERERDACRRMILTSVGVSCIGIAAVFVLVWFFSKRVFRPVQESYTKQKQFITDASHELKTPLTIISANIDLLEMEGPENQWTQSIRKQVSRLRNLTEQMVTLSRLEEEGEVCLTKCDLTKIVSETAETFEPLAQAVDKRLTVDIAEGITCAGEDEKLRQMMSLLLDNAMKYASEKGEIRVKLERGKRSGQARILVWNTVDEESGITAGNQNMLFERFYRADKSRNSRTGGSGIGLSVVKAIAERYGGRITAGSEDGRSIVFTIVL